LAFESSQNAVNNAHAAAASLNVKGIVLDAVVTAKAMVSKF